MLEEETTPRPPSEPAPAGQSNEGAEPPEAVLPSGPGATAKVGEMAQLATFKQPNPQSEGGPGKEPSFELHGEASVGLQSFIPNEGLSEDQNRAHLAVQEPQSKLNMADLDGPDQTGSPENSVTVKIGESMPVERPRSHKGDARASGQVLSEFAKTSELRSVNHQLIEFNPLQSVGATSESGAHRSNKGLLQTPGPARAAAKPEPNEQADEDNKLLDDPFSGYERDAGIYNQSLGSTLRTVFNFIKSDTQKKQRSFRIGVFTIFLVVTFLVMLKSLVDVAPIAFLKVGQDQAGLFDIQLASDYSEPFVNGNTNLYTEDPFDYGEPPEEPKQSLFQTVTQGAVKDNGDHAEILGFNLLNFGNMAEQLDALSEGDLFKGFSPRWTLPMKLRNPEEVNRNTSCMVIIIDSAREADLDLVPHFSKEIIGDSEIIVAQSALKHLGLQADRKEKAEVYLDLLATAKMFSSTSGQAGFDLPTESESERLEDQFNEMLR